ncbi:MAG: hypothetical protein ACREDU_03690, partial [Methylocella sp.]
MKGFVTRLKLRRSGRACPGRDCWNPAAREGLQALHSCHPDTGNLPAGTTLLLNHFYNQDAFSLRWTPV